VTWSLRLGSLRLNLSGGAPGAPPRAPWVWALIALALLLVLLAVFWLAGGADAVIAIYAQMVKHSSFAASQHPRLS